MSGHRIHGVDLRVSGPLLGRPRAGAAEASKVRPGHRGQLRPIPLPDLAGASVPVIRQRVGSATVMFAIDDSGSVQGPDGTDPARVRNAACLSVLDLMRRYGGGQAGVVHWGESAPADLALGPLPVRHYRRLRQVLSLQPALGGTCPAAGLARVRELVPAVGHGQTLTVFLITDGQDLGTGLEQQITRFPDRCVHLILVDPSGDCFGQEDAWRALSWASWSRLASLRDPRQVARETGAIFARSLGLRLRDSTLV